MKNKKTGKKLLDYFDFQKEYVSNVSKISVYNNESFSVINYKSIVEYEDNLLRINTDYNIIKIEGEGLIIKTLSDDEIEVVGVIKSILFE